MRKTLIIQFVLILIFSQTAYASWVDDYVASTVVTSPTASKSQTRNYYSAGGFSQRVNHRSDNLFTIAKPKISAGCGGIDVFFGGVSFLNADYLVEKAQGMLKNAPYVIFSLGLKALSTQFADTIDAANAIVDQLNSLQFDECGAAKGVVSLAMGDGAPALEAEWNRLQTNTDRMKNGFVKDFNKGLKQTNNDPQGTKKDAMKGNPIKDTMIKKLVEETGTILDDLAQNNKIDKNQADAIRAFVGDVQYDNTNKDFPDGKINVIVGCAEDKTLNDIINATPYQSKNSQKCDIVAKSIFALTSESIDKIYFALTDNSKRQSAFTTEVFDFINSTSLPVLAYMSDSSILGSDYLNTTIYALKKAAAADYAYNATQQLANEVSKTITSLRDRAKDEKYLMGMVKSLSEYEDKIHKKLSAFNNDCQNFKADYTTNSQIINYMKESGKDINSIKNAEYLVKSMKTGK